MSRRTRGAWWLVKLWWLPRFPVFLPLPASTLDVLMRVPWPLRPNFSLVTPLHFHSSSGRGPFACACIRLPNLYRILPWEGVGILAVLNRFAGGAMGPGPKSAA